MPSLCVVCFLGLFLPTLCGSPVKRRQPGIQKYSSYFGAFRISSVTPHATTSYALHPCLSRYMSSIFLAVSSPPPLPSGEADAWRSQADPSRPTRAVPPRVKQAARHGEAAAGASSEPPTFRCRCLPAATIHPRPAPLPPDRPSRSGAREVAAGCRGGGGRPTAASPRGHGLPGADPVAAGDDGVPGRGVAAA